MITAPVSIRDVQQCLGVSDTDLASLCMKSNINRWSAYKPVYMGKVGTLTDADFANGRLDAFVGYMVSHGLKIRKSSAIGDYINLDFSQAGGGDVQSAEWGDDKPIRDGVNAFRLTDFNNYYHDSSIVKINLKMSFPTNTYFYIPQSSGEVGTSIQFSLSWWNIQGAVNASTLFNDSNGIGNYVPSVILTYYTSGTRAQYVKSAKDNGGNYLYVKNIGTSEQSGASIVVSTKDIYNSLVHDNITLPNTELRWTACMVLLSSGVAGTSTDHRAIYDIGSGTNKTIVRLECLPPTNSIYFDRIRMTSAPKKKMYINSLSAAITVVKQTTTSSNGSFHRWNVSQIVFTFVKGTEDSITFTPKGRFSCQVGNAYAQGTPDSSGNYTIGSRFTVSGSGSKTITLTFSSNDIWYDPRMPESGSNVIRFSGTLLLENSAYGSWSGSYGIESSPAEYISPLSKTVALV